MPAPSVLIENALVLRDPGRGDAPEAADILIEGTTIKDIGPDLPAPADCQRLDAKGLLAIPGLINAHFHSPGNLLKGQLPGLPLELFMLYEVPPLAQSLPDPRSTRVCTLLGAAEMLRNGITSVMDDAYHVPCVTPENVDAMAQAYADIGMRATLAIDQPNRIEYEKYPFLADLLPAAIRAEMEAAPRQSDEELTEINAYLISRWHNQYEGRIRAAVSCSAPHRVTDGYLQSLNSLSLRHRIPFNMHILETRAQRVFGDVALGKSLVQFAHDRGILHDLSVVIHAIWIDENDIALLAQANAMVAHNPICNLRLGSGIAPFRLWENAGLRLCLGSDEALSDDRINMFDVMKMTGLIHTLESDDWNHWPSAERILQIALHGGAEALGRGHDLGRLAPGYQADIVLLDLDDLAFTPLNHLQRQLVFCENGRSVCHVFVAGKQVVEHGRLTQIDEKSLKEEAREIRRQQCETVIGNSGVKTLEPHYQEMLQRAYAQLQFGAYRGRAGGAHRQ
ncbi:MAG: amidohydrolase family protein [Burkholderiaceae bacterium]